MLPGISCIYFSNPFFISARAPITTGIVEAFTPTFFQVTLTEVFFSMGMVISMNRQLFVLSVLDYSVWSNGFISQSVCIGISHKIMMLSFSVSVWGSSSYHFSFLLISDYIHLFCCNWPLKLCSPYSPMCAFLDISQSSLWNVITICFILPLS